MGLRPGPAGPCLILCVGLRSDCVPAASLPLSSLPSPSGCHLLDWCQGQGLLGCGARSPPGRGGGTVLRAAPFPLCRWHLSVTPGCAFALSPSISEGQRRGCERPFPGDSRACRELLAPHAARFPWLQASMSLVLMVPERPVRSDVYGDDDATPSTQESLLRFGGGVSRLLSPSWVPYFLGGREGPGGSQKPGRRGGGAKPGASQTGPGCVTSCQGVCSPAHRGHPRARAGQEW